MRKGTLYRALAIVAGRVTSSSPRRLCLQWTAGVASLFAKKIKSLLPVPCNRKESLLRGKQEEE
jgi:hypothetical protein